MDIKNKNKKTLLIRSLTLLIFLVCFIFSVLAQNKTDQSIKSLLILHTNDIHDHLRPDYDGVGGLPFVSGFIRDMRSQRDDILILDAGDFSEKGDLVARKTSSELTFKAASRVGYHAWTPGNHDHDFGVEALHKFNDLGEMDILCINLLQEDGRLEFESSKIYDIAGLNVGVIGAIRPRDKLSLDLDETAKAMARESKRLKPETDLIVALVHISPQQSVSISKVAPNIDIFISGHSHEILNEALIVPETEALIVQAGSYGNYVGKIELSIDTDNRQVLNREFELVEMNHLEISPDLQMMEWIRKKELEITPEAGKIISWSSREINYGEVGYLAAEAIRKKTGVDIAFNHSAEIIRSTLPAGIHDLNAIYKTGGERGHQLVEFTLSGSEVRNYLQGMKKSEWFQTQWSGFHATSNNGEFETNLKPEQNYRIAMPEREYNRRFRRLFKRIEENPQDWPKVDALENSVSPKLLDVTWTDSMVHLLTKWSQQNMKIENELLRIIEQTGQMMHKVLEDSYKQMDNY